jgi:2,4-dienoyl-CoA reductase (NADPH2)
VEVRLGQTVTAEDVIREAPDAVIVATGARPAPPRWSAADGLPVVSVRDVLLGHAEVGPRVVILDEEGGYPAATLAEYLADQGHQVTLLSADMYVSQKLIATHDLFLWYQRAAAKGIALRPQVEVKRIEDGAVVIGPRFGAAEQRIEADTVVEAGYEWPEQDLYLELKALQQAGEAPTFALCRVGDCVAPRGIGPAILEGHRAAVWIAAQAVQ